MAKTEYPKIVKGTRSFATIYKSEQKKNGTDYTYFKVVYRLDNGARKTLAFNSAETAEKEAKILVGVLDKGESNTLVLSEDARWEYERAINSLKPFDVA